MILKSYKQFLNENIITNEDKEIFNNFVDDMINALEEDGFFMSFSEIAPNTNKNYDDGFEDILNHLSSKYKDVDLNYFLRNKEFINIFDNKINNNENGGTDIILNHFSKGYYLLGGYPIQDDSDSIIRYVYGWHHTKYGKKAILENFKDMKTYFEWVYNNLEEEDYILDAFDITEKVEDILLGKSSNISLMKSRSNKDIESDFKIFESPSTDHFIALITFPKEYEIFNNPEKYENTEKYIVDKLILNGKQSYLSVFNFDTSHIDDEYINKLSSMSNTMKKFNI